jgi:hypothetical protein
MTRRPDVASLPVWCGCSGSEVGSTAPLVVAT